MPLPGRQYNGGGYKYGFNGKELDANGTGMGGGGNTYDYGFRIYNPQVAKFLSVDPLIASYPWYTPYQFAGNKPIWAIDLDGLEERVVNGNGDVTIVSKYTVITQGILAVPASVDIQKLAATVALVLNSIPARTEIIETIQTISITPGDKTNPPQIIEEEVVITKEYRVQFQIDIVVNQSGTSMNDAGQRSFIADHYSDGIGNTNLLGGIIRMGDPAEFANLNPNTPAFWNNAASAQINGMTEIVLNPKFFDPSSPNFLSELEQQQTMIHEFGHGMTLDHSTGIYPQKGMMKAVDKNASLIEYLPTDNELTKIEKDVPIQKL